MRCINLLERPTSGHVIIDGKDMTVLPRKELLEMRRSISMIFQGFNLLEQRSVLRNVCFPLEMSGTKSGEAKKRALELLKLVGLESKANAYPAQLSGGQKQRVAIARALAMDPEILCFDEPTSALDPELTGEVLRVIKSLKDTGSTMIVVTHEMEFARNVSDKVMFMADGVVEEMGDPAQIFDNPQSEKTRAFLANSLEKL